MGPLIAIVDDDKSVREALNGLVRSLGYAAVVFASAEELLKFDRTGDIACLITDIQMPGLSGLDLCSRLAEEKKRIPTILITAYPNDRVMQRARDAGVTALLIKPFNESELIASLRSAVNTANKDAR